MSFIDNNNIDRSCLNKGKLHLNRRALSHLADNFKKFVGFLWKSAPLPKICQNTHKHPKLSLDELKSLRILNHNNIIVSYSNINSNRNKFDDENVDILYIAETKIDESFPIAQLILPSYHEYCLLYISDKQGGLLVYIKSHLRSRLS